jgi:6-pyruvoyl-tetrahydropterin synthase
MKGKGLEMTIEELKETLTSVITEELTDTLKNDLMNFIKQFVTELEPIADEFITKLKEQAVTETGWNAFRDKYFLPIVVQTGLYVVNKLMDKIINAAEKELDSGTVETTATTEDTTTPTTEG